MKSIAKQTTKNIIKFLSELTIFKKLSLVFQTYSSENIRHIRLSNHDYYFINKNTITNYRIDTFFTKEPETINWINNFKSNSNFWDIGANIGLYSIYSAKVKNCKVVSFEPSINNLEILSKNINFNNLSQQILIAPIALTNKTGAEYLFCSSKLGGSAHSTFGYEIDQKGNKLNSILKYQTIGLSADEFKELLSIPMPDYVKIDVDGIEELILDGAKNLLKTVKEILIEVNKDNLNQSILIKKILTKNGFYMYKDFYNYKIKQGNQIWKKNE